MASAKERARRAPPFIEPPGYFRHRPEETLLYRLVEEHYPAFVAEREAAGKPLPRHVLDEFEAYLKCGSARARFLARPPRGLPCREARRLQLQEARLLSELRAGANGGDSRTPC